MPIRFSYKGAFLLFGGLTLINLLIVPFLIFLGVGQSTALLLVNGVISSVYVSYILTFIDGKFTSWKAFVKRWVFIGVLFSVLVTIGIDV